MFGFLLAIANFFNNMRTDLQERKIEANKKIEEVKNRVREQKGLTKEESPDEKPKLVDRALSAVLYFVSLVVAFCEIVVIFIVLLKYILLFLLAIIVVILIFAFLALLQSLLAEQKEFLDGFEKPEEGSSCAQVIQGQLQWSLEELNSKGSTLTEYQKNLYRMGILAKETVTGYSTGKDNLPNTVDLHKKILFQIGVQSTEGSMLFFQYEDDKNILDYPTYTYGDKVGEPYRFMGVRVSETLQQYVGRLKQDEITAMQSKFKPKSSPSYHSQYAPYAMTMSVGHMNGKLSDVNNKAKHDGLTAVERAEKIAGQFGIKANKEEFIGMTLLMLSQAQYHGAEKKEYDAYIGYWAAIFALSSSDDTKRSFANYQIKSLEGKGVSYAESSPNRQNYIGNKDHKSFEVWGNYANMKLDGSRSWGIYLNGKLIDEPLWKFVGTNTPNKQAFAESWGVVNSVALGRGSIQDRVLNFHYGLNSFWQGLRVENDLAALMSLGGETKAEMVCSDGSTTESVVPGQFKATPGQSRVIINGKPLKQYMEDYYKKAPSSKVKYLKGLELFWGTSSYLQNADNPARKAGYVDKIHGVPFYGQSKQYNEAWGTYSYVPGGNTFYRSACMIYSYAYAASSQLGILINPAEMGSILHANGGFSGNLVYTNVVPGVMKQLGLNGKNASNFNELDSYLDKGGVAVIRTKPGPSCGKAGTADCFTNNEHFQVITGKEQKNGKTYYHMFTSSYHTQSTALYTMAEISRNVAFGKQNPVLYVWK